MSEKPIGAKDEIMTGHEYNDIPFGVSITVTARGIDLREYDQDRRHQVATVLAFYHLSDVLNGNGLDPAELLQGKDECRSCDDEPKGDDDGNSNEGGGG